VEKRVFAALTNPASVAVVGASDPATSFYGGHAFRNLLLGSGPDRRIYPVNVRQAGGTLLGQRVYGALPDLPERPELTVIATPWRSVPEILTQVADSSGDAVVLLSAYRGRDPNGSREFDELIRSASAAGGFGVIGPNTLGVLRPRSRLFATFATALDRRIDSAGEIQLNPGGLAMLSQSGAVLSYMLDFYRERSLGYSYLVSTGNECCFTLPEILEEVVEDAETTSILLFVEGVDDGARFRRALARAHELHKPVAMMKVGSSAAGRQTAQSHTGRMTGDNAVYEALVADSAVTIARSHEDLFELGYRFDLGRRANPGGAGRRRAMVISTSGGAAAVMADLLAESGWQLGPLSPATSLALSAVIGDNHAANPLDVTGAFVDTDLIPRALQVLDRLGEFDEIFLVSGAGGDSAVPLARAVADAGSSISTPLTIAWIALAAEARKVLEAARIPVFGGYAQAADVSGASQGRRDSRATYRADARENSAPDGQEPAPSKPALTSTELFPLLEAAGISCAPYEVVNGTDPDLALQAAERIGYPLAIKIDDAAVLHKSDVGALSIGIEGRGRLLAEWQRLAELTKRLRCGERFLIQKMITGPELFVGSRRDKAFGNVLVVGLGGVLAELLSDYRTLLLPATQHQVESLIAEHPRLGALLAGYRGSHPLDPREFAGLITRVGEWIERADPAVEELDLNPIVLSSAGAVVVDARAVVGTSRPTGSSS
jgi:acyl-CoA synthetase (NDP forming)